MDDETEDEGTTGSYEIGDLEVEIIKILRAAMGSTYNSLDGWALIIRAHSNDGDGDRQFGSVIMPPGQDAFTNAGLRWLFEQGSGA